MTIPRIALFVAIIATYYFEGATSVPPPTRWVKVCRNRVCRRVFAPLECVRPRTDRVCMRIKKLTVLYGNQIDPRNLRELRCRRSRPCPAGAICYRGRCCYGQYRRFETCRCLAKCSTAYSCQKVRADCGHSYACLPRIKPGMCPKPLPVKCDPAAKDSCQKDEHCSDGRKCCNNGCFLTCQNPVFVKPGVCPVINPTKIFCPAVIGLKNRCELDTQCEGNKKCCKGGCGVLICSEPANPNKPGYCPYSLAQPLCLGTDPKKCKDDTQCSGTDKCCSTLCGGTDCKAASDKKPGECRSSFDPRIACAQLAPPCKIVDDCQQDKDCDKGKKCCSNQCAGKTCQEPIIAMP